MPYENARCADIVSETLDETSVVSLIHRQHIEQCGECRRELEAQRAARSQVRLLRDAQIIEVQMDVAGMGIVAPALVVGQSARMGVRDANLLVGVGNPAVPQRVWRP